MKLKQVLKKIIPVSRFDYQNLKEDLESLKKEFELSREEVSILKNDYERIDVKFTDIIRKKAEET